MRSPHDATGSSGTQGVALLTWRAVIETRFATIVKPFRWREMQVIVVLSQDLMASSTACPRRVLLYH